MKISRISLKIILICLTALSVVNAQGADVTVTDVSSIGTSCSNSSDGSITVTVSGGVGQYTYLLVKSGLPVEIAGPTSSNTFTFINHEQYPAYQILISDEDINTLDGFTYAAIGGPDPIAITSAIPVDITCNNANNGTIEVIATGEDGNFIFTLTGPDNQTNNSGMFAGLPQGDYTVEVSHDGPCTSTAVSPVLTINNPTPISINTDLLSHISCFGDNTGSISITPSGGTPGGAGTGYTYAWTGPNGFTSSAEDITSLFAGDYFVTVFDGNLCSSNAGPITINEPSELTAVLSGITPATCFGDNDGTVTIIPGGGVGGYTFSWEGQVSGLISTAMNPVNLVADTYDLTLSDGNGCSKTFTDFAIITEPDVLDASVVTTIDV
ncbi:MAG: hypothetical protein GY790_15945, partial [Bacteroidetes bacterium]|nr:hypothetical protein [Bacteroidota bacterium]